MAAINHSEIRLRNHLSDYILPSATASLWGLKKVMKCLRFSGVPDFFLAAFIQGTLKDLSKHLLRCRCHMIYTQVSPNQIRMSIYW